MTWDNSDMERLAALSRRRNTSQHADGSPRGAGEPPRAGEESGARAYDPRKVVVTFNGVELKGFADATFIEVEREPAPIKTGGGSVTLSLQAHSPNAHEAMWAELQRAIDNQVALAEHERIRKFFNWTRRCDQRDRRRIRMARKKRRGWA